MKSLQLFTTTFTLCSFLVSCGTETSGEVQDDFPLSDNGVINPSPNLPEHTHQVSKFVEPVSRKAASAALTSPPQSKEEEIADAFHLLYHSSDERTWKDTYWMGIGVLKNPLDLWIYQETIYQVKPDVIIEAGTASGGSALFMAHLLDILGKGKIVTVDIEPADALSGEHSSLEPTSRERPKHSRINYVTGSTTDPTVQALVRDHVPSDAVVLVILDSDHHMEHVLAEMEAYADLVTPGSYLIVEDTNLGGHPVCADFFPGPMGAVEVFLETRHDFAADAAKEKFFFSFNPRGFLQKAQVTEQ